MKKQHNRKRFPRIVLALLLILSMLGNTLILPTVAEETASPVDEALLLQSPEMLDESMGVPTLPEPILLTAADIPEFISSAELDERGAVERMRAEETTMSNVIFRNADGTRTMYMYGLPVKYTTADGTVRDKSTNLVSVSTASVLLSDQPVAQTMAQMSTAQRDQLQTELGILDVERAADTLHMLSTSLTARQRSLSDMAYTTLDNDVYALFPTNLAQGLTLVFGEHSVRMTPAGTGMTVTAGGNVTKTTASSLSDANVTERLLYPNVFGPGTAVQYTPTLTGVKEEILLSRNVGKNSFAFLLETGGLVLTQQNGQYVLVDPTVGETVSSLGSIIVYDSAGEIALGTLTAQTILAGQKYGITISVDQEFLASATYPVSIDPTVYLNPVQDDYEHGESVFIEDVAIYSHEDAWSLTLEDYHLIGNVSPYYDYAGIAVYRFPLLYEQSPLNPCYNLTSDQIYMFRLRLVAVGGENTPENKLYANLYTADWVDNGWRICDPEYYDRYNTIPYNIPITSIPTSGVFHVDLTSIAREWADMLHGASDITYCTPMTGVALRNGDISKSRVVYAAGYTYQMCAIIDYGDPVYTGTFYLNNMETRKFLGTTDTSTTALLSGQVDDIGNQIAWKTAYQGSNMYSLHPNGNMNLYLDNCGDIIAGPTDNDGFWNISFSGVGGVVLTNCYSGEVLMADDANSVTVLPGDSFSAYEKAWRMVQTDSYIELNPNQVSSNVIWVAPEEHVNIFNYLSNSHFSQADDFIYTINSSAVTHSDGIIVGVVPNATAAFVLYHKPTGQSMPVSIRVAPLKEGNYFFQSGVPLSTPNMFMQIDDLYAPDYNTNMASLELRSLNGEEHQEWILTRVYNDYYSVISAKSGKAVAVRSTYVDSGMGVLAQETYNSLDRQLWKFEETTNGTYVVRPKSAESYSTDWCMATTSSTSEGKSVIQSAYWADNNLTDEWILAYIETSSDVEHEGQQMSMWCWVTAARIFAKHYYPEVTRTQGEAVAFVRGSTINDGGFEDYGKTAVEYYIGNIDDAALNLQYAMSDSPSTKKIYSEEILRRFLDDGHVVYITRNRYEEGEYDGGHATVITGYVSITVGGVTQYRYIVYDPWPSPRPSPWDTQQTTDGQKYLRSYQWICNGSKVSSGYEPTDTGVWEGYITVVTSYSGESIPPDKS